MKWRYSFCIWQHHLIFLNLLIRFYPKENPQITISATLLFTLFMMNYNQVAASDCQSNGDILFLTFAFALSCLILCHPMDRSTPDSCPWGFQAKILECLAISYSKGSLWPVNGTHIPCASTLADRFFTTVLQGITYLHL